MNSFSLFFFLSSPTSSCFFYVCYIWINMCDVFFFGCSKRTLSLVDVLQDLRVLLLFVCLMLDFLLVWQWMMYWQWCFGNRFYYRSTFLWFFGWILTLFNADTCTYTQHVHTQTNTPTTIITNHLLCRNISISVAVHTVSFTSAQIDCVLLHFK